MVGLKPSVELRWNDPFVYYRQVYQWKKVFKPGITKKAVEIIFSVQNNKPIHPDLIFNAAERNLLTT